jgi:hypothetical protein
VATLSLSSNLQIASSTHSYASFSLSSVSASGAAYQPPLHLHPLFNYQYNQSVPDAPSNTTISCYAHNHATHVIHCTSSPDKSSSQALDWALGKLVKNKDVLIVLRGIGKEELGKSTKLLFLSFLFKTCFGVRLLCLSLDYFDFIY